MLGCVRDAKGAGQTDRLLAGVAATLQARGWRLAGAVQDNRPAGPGRPWAMDLRVLSGATVIPISQDLGTGARGCRLDAGALEKAVGLVAAALAAHPALLIVNKFGKQEAEGRGFRPLIGQALADGVPVLTAVGGANRAAFDAFAGDLATPLPADAAALLDWCARVAGRPRAPAG